MENGFTSPRNEGFPAGLRVLVVDDDPTWLKILEKMLKKCSYEVTTCGLARDALNLLRERKDGFDIVISDVNMPDMDGFKLLEHVGLEMDLPVIMMSVDGETSRVMKGVQHGACDYLLKPIRMKELRNIWQHVFRKRIHEVRDIELLEGMDGIQMPRSAWGSHDEANLLYGDGSSSLRKRKDTESRHDEKDTGDNFSMKKARVVWSVDLHQKFVKAVNQIGYDKVGPKKILDLMNVPWLTRENVASHLQKYRLYLTRLQKENDEKNSVSGVKQSDSPSSSKDHAGNVGSSNSISMPRSDVSNPSSGVSGNRADSRSNDADRKATVSIPVTEKQVSNVNVSASCVVASSQLEFRCPFTPIQSGQNAKAFDSSVPIQYTWCEMQEIQAKQDQKPHCVDNDMIHLLLPNQQQHLQADSPQPSLPISSGLSAPERGVCSPTQNFYGKQTSNTNHVSPAASVAESNHCQINMAAMENNQTRDPDISSFKRMSPDLSRFIDLEPGVKTMNQGMLPLPSLDEDLQVHWFQGDCYAMNLGLQNVEYYDTVPNNEPPPHIYDTFRSDFDYLYDPNECFVDQGLFIL